MHKLDKVTEKIYKEFVISKLKNSVIFKYESDSDSITYRVNYSSNNNGEKLTKEYRVNITIKNNKTYISVTDMDYSGLLNPNSFKVVLLDYTKRPFFNTLNRELYDATQNAIENYNLGKPDLTAIPIEYLRNGKISTLISKGENE